MTELIGQLLGEYQIERVIGQGSMGTVYEGRDSRQRRVAIKVMPAELAAQDGFRRQFLRDMQLLSALEHPNLVRIYEAGQSGGWLYLAMEYLDAGSLRQYLDQYTRNKQFVPLPSVLDYVEQVATGLNYAHDQAIIHQDMKPENVLFRLQGDGQFQMVVSDLKARELARNARGSEVMQLESALPYMAPEVCEGRPAEVEADVYSLGVILYHMAVGQLPFRPRNIAEAARMHRSEPVPLPSRIRQGLPVELERIILKCLAKDPSQRYGSAARLARDIQEVQIQLQHKYPTNLNLSTNTSYSTNVSFETAHHQDSLYTQPELTTGQVGYDRLVVAIAGQPTRAYSLDKRVLVIGRDSSADIVLDSPLISRYHLRLERLVSGDYQVTDLGSTNGSWLDDLQLVSNRAQIWAGGQFLRLGDFRLTIEPVANLILTQPGSFDPSQMSLVQPDEANEPQEIAPVALNISLKLTPEWITVVPGEQQSIQLEVLNESSIVDHFLVRISSIPSEWVKVQDVALEVLSDAGRNRGTLTLIFSPPRTAKSVAGMYSFEVAVSSVGQPNALPVVVPGRMQIEPFHEFTSDVQPTRIRTDQKKPVLTLLNAGNAPHSYTIDAVDREEALNFVISPSRILLDPGQSMEIPVLVTPRFRPLFGRTQRYTFEIEVSDGRVGTSKVHTGDFEVSPFISQRMIGLITLMLVMCGIGSVCSISQLIAFFGQQQASAAAAATQAYYVTQTRIAESDTDSDGLANYEEATLGTDPALSDTDGDSVSDYDEAKVFGTNPLAIDTDNDTLDDGSELRVPRCLDGRTSNPNNPDTDGDSAADNVDPDPCLPPTPIPQPPLG